VTCKRGPCGYNVWKNFINCVCIYCLDSLSL